MGINALFQNKKNQEDGSVEAKSIRAAFWSILGRGGGHFFRLAGNLILTRILLPEAFGLMATANVALSMVSLFSDTGVKTAIIQNPRGAEPEFLNTSWIISLCRGMFLFVVMLLLANPLSRFYGEPDLKGILGIMAFSPLILGFESPALTLTIKNFKAEKLVKFELVTQLLSLATTIGLTLLLQTVYGLAIGVSIASFYRMVGSHIIFRYRPRFSWSKTAGLELFHFGKFIFLNTMVTWMAVNIDIFLIGKSLGMDMLGFYNIGKNFSYLIITFCLQVTSQAYLPAISAVAGDPSRVIGMYKRATSMMMAIAVPISMVLVLFSYDIIGLLYDPRYQMAYISMFWLSLCGIFRILGILTGTTFIATGKPVLESISIASGLLAAVIFIPVGIRVGGLSGGSIGMAAALFIPVVVRSGILMAKLHFPLKVTCYPWLQSFLVMSMNVGLFLMIRQWLKNVFLYNIPSMLVMGTFGLIVSAGIYMLLERPSLTRDNGKLIPRLSYKV